MYTKFRASSAYTYSVAQLLDNNHSFPSNSPDSKDCAGVILYAAERATECALDAVQCMGGMGYVNEIPAGRLVRDAKLYEIGAGTSKCAFSDPLLPSLINSGKLHFRHY